MISVQGCDGAVTHIQWHKEITPTFPFLKALLFCDQRFFFALSLLLVKLLFYLPPLPHYVKAVLTAPCHAWVFVQIVCFQMFLKSKFVCTHVYTALYICISVYIADCTDLNGTWRAVAAIVTLVKLGFWFFSRPGKCLHDFCSKSWCTSHWVSKWK